MDSAAASRTTSWRTRERWAPASGIRNRFQTVLDGSGPTWWTTELGAKDARPATEQVESEGLTRLRLGPLIRDPYQAAAHAGLSEDDIAFVSRLYR